MRIGKYIWRPTRWQKALGKVTVGLMLLAGTYLFWLDAFITWAERGM